MTVHREALMIGFLASLASYGRSLTLSAPEGGRQAFDVDAGNRPEDLTRFYPLGIRGADSDSMLSVAANLATVVFTVSVEDFNEGGKQWMPDEGWTLEDGGPVDRPLSVPEKFRVKRADRAMDGMLFRIECVRVR